MEDEVEIQMDVAESAKKFELAVERKGGGQ